MIVASLIDLSQIFQPGGLFMTLEGAFVCGIIVGLTIALFLAICCYYHCK